MKKLKERLSIALYRILVKVKSEEWVAYYIFKSEPATLKGLKEGIKFLESKGEKPKPHIIKLLNEKQRLWNEFKKSKNEKAKD